MHGLPVLSVSNGAPVAGSTPSDSGSGLPCGPPPVAASVILPPATVYVPFRTTMPDHTQATLGGHGETRSSALNVPPSAKSICRAYVRSPHEDDTHVPASEPPGVAVVAGAEVVAGAAAVPAVA